MTASSDDLYLYLGPIIIKYIIYYEDYYTHAHTALTIIEPYFSAEIFSQVQGSERVLQTGRRSRELVLETRKEIFSRLQDAQHITTKQLPCISTRVCYQVVRPSHKYRYAVRRVDDDEEDEEVERRTRRRSEERRAREARAAASQYTAQTQAHTDEAYAPLLLDVHTVELEETLVLMGCSRAVINLLCTFDNHQRW
uniref:Uncharacterized protein n=1 Tax=Trichogramma kaykai TaxID=54128 RepID=A0ABD2WMM5_9HYME